MAASLLPLARARDPVRSGIAKWVYRYTCQDVCPYNRKFASELAEPAFAPRSALLGTDASALARTLPATSPSEFSEAFRGSPMKRAKLRGLERNAAVVLGNAGTPDDADVLERALDDQEPLVRQHAAWALARLGGSAASALEARLASEADPAVRAEVRAALKALGVAC